MSVAPRCKIYVEGGARSDLKAMYAKAFRGLLTRAGIPGRSCEILLHGSRSRTYQAFCKALERREAPFVVLLVDSETAVDTDSRKWDHLLRQPEDQWNKPKGATEENVFLMVQCMEAWLACDPEAWRATFGNNFRPEKMPSVTYVEHLAPKDLLQRLKQATGDRYSKAAAPRVLQHLRIECLEKPPHAYAFLRTLKQNLGN